MIVNYAGWREVVRFIDGERVTTHEVRGAQSLVNARALELESLPLGYIGHCRRELKATRVPMMLEEWRASISGGKS